MSKSIVALDAAGALLLDAGRIAARRVHHRAGVDQTAETASAHPLMITRADLDDQLAAVA